MTMQATPGGAGSRTATFAVVGWSGFFLLSVEVLSGRILAPFYGTSVAVWGGVLAVFMASLALGNLLGGMLSTRQPALWKLAVLLAAEALLTLPVVTAAETVLEPLSVAVPDPRYGSLLGSLVLFAVPAIMSGMIAPYAIRLLVRGIATSGREAGWCYFVSTIGSAAGTVVVSFYLVLLMDIYRIITLLGTVSVVLAGATAAVSYFDRGVGDE